MGLIGRTVPQLNVMNLGFALEFDADVRRPVASRFGGALWAFHDQIEPTLETILDALNVPLRTEWFS